MGLLDRFKKDNVVAKALGGDLMDEGTAARLKEQQDMANALIAQHPGAMPDLSGDPAELQAQAERQRAEAELVQRLVRKGVEAPAVIRRIEATGEADLGGGTRTEIVVSIKDGGGELHDAHVRQHMTPAQLEGLAPGRPVTVRYDPGSPGVAVLTGW